MWKQRRKTKKEKNANRAYAIIRLVSIILSLFTIFSLGVYLYIVRSRPLYVSPLPGVFMQSLMSTKDRELEDVLLRNNVSFSRIEYASGSSILVTLKSGEEVILSSQKPIAQQISSLQVIISRLTIEGKHFARLDLRFDKPIVVLKE